MDGQLRAVSTTESCYSLAPSNLRLLPYDENAEKINFSLIYFRIILFFYNLLSDGRGNANISLSIFLFLVVKSFNLNICIRIDY